MRVRYTVDALRHLSSIARYIRDRDASAAARVRDRLRSAAERLRRFPQIGRSGAAPGSREWKVPGLPYVIVHEIDADADEVIILGIFHEAQLRPGQRGQAHDD